MKLLFKQKLFSWFDSYDIFDEQGSTVYVVKGQLSWGHCLKIMLADGTYVGMVKQVVLSWLPRFEIYLGEECIGSIKKELTLFKPKFTLDVNDWSVEGNWYEWNYEIHDASGAVVARIDKELSWTDTYMIDVADPEDALAALMVVLAIDAEKCSRD